MAEALVAVARLAIMPHADVGQKMGKEHAVAAVRLLLRYQLRVSVVSVMAMLLARIAASLQNQDSRNSVLTVTLLMISSNALEEKHY